MLHNYASGGEKFDWVFTGKYYGNGNSYLK